jgi:hypothetical protein
MTLDIAKILNPVASYGSEPSCGRRAKGCDQVILVADCDREGNYPPSRQETSAIPVAYSARWFTADPVNRLPTLTPPQQACLGRRRRSSS